MKFAFAIALATMACAAYVHADHDHGRHGSESIYNKNTNINRNKNKDRASVWSSIWDSLFSSQTTIEQQQQFQACMSNPPCRDRIFSIVKDAEKDADKEHDDDDSDDGEKSYDDGCHGGQCKPCHHEDHECIKKQHHRARIYNKNTNKNFNNNKVTADVWSRITDELSSFQWAWQSQQQEQSCKPDHICHATGCICHH